MLRLVGALEEQKWARRVLDQLVGAGCGSGALLHEASEAVSKADLANTLGSAAMELNETRYWLRLVEHAEWLPADRLQPLATETLELLKITGALIARARRS